MEYLQYIRTHLYKTYTLSFKPYYKWNTFNTMSAMKTLMDFHKESFKPYYKWNTFNTWNKVIAPKFAELF